MNWWCSATSDPWSWQPRAYPGIWATMIALLVGYLLAWRHRPSPATDDDHRSDRRKRWAFIAGVLLLWLATDWPLGLLGASYLASAHMAQYVIYTMAAAPLLVVGTPEWMLRRVLSRLRLYRVVRGLAHPVVAAILFNVVLVATHAPMTVDALRTNQLGSFVMDAAWLLSAVLLWLPVCGTLDELKPSLPVRGVYLFLAAGVFPMIPGGFLTFADSPLYAVYELAPRVEGIDATSDQQFAGALMKVGNVPLLWPVLLAIFIRWAHVENPTGVNRKPRPATTSATAGAGPDTGESTEAEDPAGGTPPPTPGGGMDQPRPAGVTEKVGRDTGRRTSAAAPDAPPGT
jgi:putative membrane protein